MVVMVTFVTVGVDLVVMVMVVYVTVACVSYATISGTLVGDSPVHFCCYTQETNPQNSFVRF